MLVNVCPCRWSRVHETCLTNLLKHSTSCGVCKQEIAHDPRAMLSLTQLLCQTYPWAVLIHQLFSLVVAFIALAIILRSYISLKECATTRAAMHRRIEPPPRVATCRRGEQVGRRLAHIRVRRVPRTPPPTASSSRASLPFPHPFPSPLAQVGRHTCTYMHGTYMHIRAQVGRHDPILHLRHRLRNLQRLLLGAGALLARRGALRPLLRARRPRPKAWVEAGSRVVVDGAPRSVTRDHTAGRHYKRAPPGRLARRVRIRDLWGGWSAMAIVVAWHTVTLHACRAGLSKESHDARRAEAQSEVQSGRNRRLSPSRPLSLVTLSAKVASKGCSETIP